MVELRSVHALASDLDAALRRLLPLAVAGEDPGGGELTDHLLAGDLEASRTAHVAVTDPDDDITAVAVLVADDQDRWTMEAVVPAAAAETIRSLVGAAIATVEELGARRLTWWLERPVADRLGPSVAPLAVERTLLELRVPLPLGDTSPVPDGLTVRAFVPGRDEEAFVAVNNRAFAGHPEQGDWTTATVEAREAEPWFDPAGFLLAVDAGDHLAGFCWTKVHPPGAGEPRARGEIYVIGVDPAFQGTGLGRALAVAGMRHVADAGVDLGLLYVDAANVPAVRLYTDLGFREARAQLALAWTATAP